MSTAETSPDIQRLADLLAGCKQPLFLVGAGLSTESGIPDFRGPQGFWKTNEPIQFSDFLRSPARRVESFQRHLALLDLLASCEPNDGHRALARLMARWPECYLVTQNVDGLQQQAGCPQERIIEIHGNATYAHCLSCERRMEFDAVRECLESSGQAPDCPGCGGLVKTATISFGQPMPERELRQAMALAASCDLFVCLGSSLQVYPVADLPVMAKQTGAGLAIVNREPTPLDGHADVVVAGSLGEVLGQVATMVCRTL